MCTCMFQLFLSVSVCMCMREGTLHAHALILCLSLSIVPQRCKCEWGTSPSISLSSLFPSLYLPLAHFLSPPLSPVKRSKMGWGLCVRVCVCTRARAYVTCTSIFVHVEMHLSTVDGILVSCVHSNRRE